MIVGRVILAARTAGQEPLNSPPIVRGAHQVVKWR